MAVSGKKIYWTDSGNKKIQRADWDGSNVEDLVMLSETSPLRPDGIALDVDEGFMYWTEWDQTYSTNARVRRADMDGLFIKNFLEEDGWKTTRSIALTREIDTDGDGELDPEDTCPNEDATGFDLDGDGCNDNMLEALVTEGIIEEKLQNSLLSKVENAEKSVDKDNFCAAVNKLEALINEINAQREKKSLLKRQTLSLNMPTT